MEREQKAQVKVTFFPLKQERLLDTCKYQHYVSPPVLVLCEILATTKQWKAYDKALGKVKSSIFLPVSHSDFLLFSDSVPTCSLALNKPKVSEWSNFRKENSWIKTKCLYQDHSHWRNLTTTYQNKREEDFAHEAISFSSGLQ